MSRTDEQWAEAICSHSASLVELLSETRNTTPHPDDSDREVWMKLGEQRLIDHLKHLATRSGTRRFT